jgi:hypothetical protein
VQDVATTETEISRKNASHFTPSMQTEVHRSVNGLVRLSARAQADTDLALRFRVAHPLWREEISAPSGAMD